MVHTCQPSNWAVKCLGVDSVLVGRHKEKNHFQDLSVYGSIILKISPQELLWEGMKCVSLA
jgi:hypothetical protein